MTPFRAQPVSTGEKRVLRELAKAVAEIAARPEQEEKRRIWYAQNSLKPVRPPVFCLPEGSWVELLPEDALSCESEQARGVEWDLRQRVYAAEHFRDDWLCDAVYRVSPVVHQTGWGLCPEYVRSDSERGAYTWESPIKTRADLEKLQTPRVVVDWDATHEWLGFYQELLDDTLQVEIHGTLWWTLGLIDQWVLLRGLNQTFLDMRDDPELVHAGMRRLMEGTLVWLDSLESQGLLSLNNGNDLMASSNFGFTRELPAPGFDGHVRPIDLWGYAEAQAFALVSPAMHEEFVLQYQVPVLDRFGLNIYGCCEALHHKLDMLKRSVPRLRRVAISPWADKRISAEQLGPDYIYCWKPNPAELAAVDFSCERVRQDIRETIEITREHGCVLEVILQDTHTCNNQPWRFDEWTRIAMEEVMREWG